MGDMGDTFNDMRQMKKERHVKWYKQNMHELMNCNIDNFQFVHKDTVCLFREPNKPKVDFYPHTGRWRTVGKKSKIFRGGSKSFLNWYSNQ